MKCYYIASVNGNTVFEPREAPVPHPGKGELLVKVRAASLNRGEILATISLHAVHEPKPAGADCAGEVEAVGEGVTAFKKGDRVMGRARGCFAEYVAMSVEQAAPAPARLSWDEAGSIPGAAITAYEAICSLGRLTAGETLLVVGATSGVGMFGVQIGKYLGCRVVGTSRSAHKLEKLKHAGLDVGIVAAGGGFADAVLKATDGKGVNLAINLVGGSAFPDCVRSLANKGRLGIIGYVDHSLKAEVDLEAVHGRRLQIFGVSNALMSVADRAEAMRGFIRDLLPAFTEGKVTPIVDKVFPFHELPAAKLYMESDAQLGKVVVTIP